MGASGQGMTRKSQTKQLAQRRFNRSKFQNLLLYICQQVSLADLGKTKLGNCLWLSDIRAYAEEGKPITGETYVKQQFGPVPRHIPETIRQLRADGRLAVRKWAPLGYPQDAFFPIAKADLKEFTSREMAIVGEVIQFVCYEHTAKSISEFSHDRVWEMAEIGEEIPLQAIFVAELGEIDTDDVAWAKTRLAARAS